LRWTDFEPPHKGIVEANGGIGGDWSRCRGRGKGAAGEGWDVRGWSGVGRQASGVGREWEGKRSSGRQVIRMREVGGVPELSRTSATIKGSRSKAR
jgi:hypothetical protein